MINAIASLGDDGPQTVDGGLSSVAHDQNWTLADSWIWARLQQLVRDVERLFQTFQYGEGRQADL